METKTKRTALNIIAQCVAFAVNLGISFFLTPYITKMLGKEVYGFVGLAYQVTSYISVFTVAFNTMLNVFVSTEYYKDRMERANRFYTSVLYADTALALLMAAPLVFLSLKMELFLNVPMEAEWDIKLLWLFIFITFLLNLAYGPYGVGLFIKNRLDLSAIRNIESNLIKAIVLILLFAVLSPKVWFVGFAAFLSGVFIIVTNLHYQKKLVPEIKGRREWFEWSALKELLSVGIWNTINQLTSILMNGLDLIVSNIFIGALQMGYISYAQTVPTQMLGLIAVIKNTFMPRLTKVYAKSGDRMDEFVGEVKASMQVCGFLGSIPILLFMVFGMDFYRLWIPSLTEEEVRTINYLAILILIPSMLDVYISPLYNVNSITKKIKIPVFVTFGIGIANIVFELLLLKMTNLGVYAIEIATAVLMAGKVLLFTPVYAAKILRVKWQTFYSPLAKGGITSGLCLAIFFAMHRLLPIHSWITFLMVCGSSLLIGYVISFFIVLTKENRRRVVAMMPKKIIYKWKEVQKYVAATLCSFTADYVVAGTPCHGNLGDQAIAVGQMRFLRQYFPDKKILELDGDLIRKAPAGWLKAVVSQKEILLQGGGFLGALYPREERMVQRMLRMFPRNKTVIFPQTLYYSPDGENMKKEAKDVYDAHQNLTLCVREKTSYVLARDLFRNVRVELIPDMVLFLERQNAKAREGVTLCMRRDKEKKVSTQEIEIIKDSCARNGLVPIRETDTVVGYDIDAKSREEAVLSKINEFAGSRLVITDRLHGMVMGYLAGTNVIALESLNHKVRGVYHWIEGCDSVHLAKDSTQLQEMIEALNTTPGEAMDFTEYFDRLAELIKDKKI
ncbi:MAG: polysaccharide pyruvyl transferase family protein [Acetatifactor sp.]|nr:polysaccharide pyruvyl transferase family protein [Acetatifactor sp.]